MQRLFKVAFIFITAVFIIIQFFQPEKNSTDNFSSHIFEKEQVPENIKDMLKSACFDCHSNQTTYLWYHKIAPVSWMVNKHVINGKDELNLSLWGEMDIYDKIGTLEEICQEVERKKMPLKSYTIMHKEAKLSEKQIAELCAWTEKLSLELLAAVEN